MAKYYTKHNNIIYKNNNKSEGFENLNKTCIF